MIRKTLLFVTFFLCQAVALLSDPIEQDPLTVEEHYALACSAYEKEDWYTAIRHFQRVTIQAPLSDCGKESFFFLGVSFYQYKAYEFANWAFTSYLKFQDEPIYMEETIRYKCNIADAFLAGSRRHVMGSKILPALLNGIDMALETYDELITAFPCHPLAAHALYAKGQILLKKEQFREAVDCYQLLLRRFPKQEMAPDAYLMICKVYLEQAKIEHQNPDILQLAQLNAKKFEKDFPSDERLAAAEKLVQDVKETFANGLYSTGLFYERCSEPKASLIYYQNALRRFPDTAVAEKCKKRLNAIQQKS